MNNYIITERTYAADECTLLGCSIIGYTLLHDLNECKHLMTQRVAGLRLLGTNNQTTEYAQGYVVYMNDCFGNRVKYVGEVKQLFELDSYE